MACEFSGTNNKLSYKIQFVAIKQTNGSDKGGTHTPTSNCRLVVGQPLVEAVSRNHGGFSDELISNYEHFED